MRRQFYAIMGASFLGVACLLSTGCGSGTSTVAGRVTYQGKPVTSGSVIVYCQDKQIVRGLIGADGHYSIPNVPAGRALVTVQSHGRVPSGLQMRQNVPPSSGGPIPERVESADAQVVQLPVRYSLPEESGLSVTVDRGTVTYDIDLKP